MSILKIEDITRRYEGRESLSAIAHDYSCTPQYIGQFLRRHGVPTRVGGGNFTPEERAADEDYIRFLLNHGLTASAIADRFGVRPSSMCERVRRLRQRWEQERIEAIQLAIAEAERVRKRANLSFENQSWKTSNPWT